jgi:hypothetical protein
VAKVYPRGPLPLPPQRKSHQEEAPEPQLRRDRFSIHRSAWKESSRKFAGTRNEAGRLTRRGPGLLRSGPRCRLRKGALYEFLALILR